MLQADELAVIEENTTSKNDTPHKGRKPSAKKTGMSYGDLIETIMKSQNVEL